MAADAIKHVGFIGAGRMGGPMALNLQRAGWEVRAFDVAADRRAALAAAGLAAVDSARAAAAGAQAIVLMLPSDEALCAVMEGEAGLLHDLRPGQVVVDMATSLLSTSQRLAQLAAERGAALLDAPVSGGQAGAQAGTLSIMVGGEPADYERCRPLLQAMGTTVTHIGGSGMGLIAKYVNQMIMEATFCAVAEAFGLAAKAGAELGPVFEAVRHGLAGSRVLELMVPQLLSGDLGDGRELTLHYKDGGYALAAGETVGAWTPFTALAHEVFEQALAAGQGEHHASGVARVYEQRSGVRLVGSAA